MNTSWVHSKGALVWGASHQTGWLYRPPCSSSLWTLRAQNLFTGWNTCLWAWINFSDSNLCDAVRHRNAEAKWDVCGPHLHINPQTPLLEYCCFLTKLLSEVWGKKTHKSLDSLVKALDSFYFSPALENCEAGSLSSTGHSCIMF